MPKIEKQILKHRSKIYDKRKQPIDIGKNLLFITDVPTQSAVEDEIVKIKKFPIEAIEVKEAVENLELIGHTFYLFLNIATNQVEAVYRRNDGSIGLLQPYIQD
ncbi:MAG: sigma 54 modulation/S30EA ribosomal C-terminal domain-containing protein [Clostridia bacterium]